MKKKILLLLTAIFVSLASHAQFENNKLYLGAGFSSLDLNYKSDTKWNLELCGKVGCTFMDNWMLLADGYWGIRQKSPNDFALGAGVRYYIEQNGLYLGAGARYKHADSYDDIMPNVAVGYAFFLNRTVTLEPELYYDISTKNLKDYSGFGLRVGIGIYLDELF